MLNLLGVPTKRQSDHDQLHPGACVGITEVLVDLIKLDHADRAPRYLINHIIPEKGRCAKPPSTRPSCALINSITVNHVPKLSRVVDIFATSPLPSTEKKN